VEEGTTCFIPQVFDLWFLTDMLFFYVVDIELTVVSFSFDNKIKTSCVKKKQELVFVMRVKPGAKLYKYRIKNAFS
jgi:hypothetical protein